MNALRVGLVVSFLLAVPFTAWAEDELADVPKYNDGGSFLLSAAGLPAGVGRLGVELNGLVGFVDSDAFFVPALGVRYVRGLTGPLDLRLSLVTLGLYNDFDAGIGVALLSTPNVAVGLRAGVTGNVVITSDGGGGVFAGTPGVVFTTRSEGVAFSIGADVPLYFNGFVVTPSRTAAGSGFVFSVRPGAALEIGSGGGAKFYARADATIFVVDTETSALAHFALGVHF